MGLSGYRGLTDLGTGSCRAVVMFFCDKTQSLSLSDDGPTVKIRSAGQGKVKDPKSTPVCEAYALHGLSLKRFIGRFMRNSSDIEDIAQESFLRAYAVERGRPIEQPKSFLFWIAKHLALSQLTRKSRQIIDYIEDFMDSGVIQLEHSAEEEFSPSNAGIALRSGGGALSPVS